MSLNEIKKRDGLVRSPMELQPSSVKGKQIKKSIAAGRVRINYELNPSLFPLYKCHS